MRIQTCEECSQNRDSPCCVQVFQILLTETAGLTVAGSSTLLAYILFCVLVKFQRVSIVVEFLLGPRHIIEESAKMVTQNAGRLLNNFRWN